jgi:hypothetical protein
MSFSFVFQVPSVEAPSRVDLRCETGRQLLDLPPGPWADESGLQIRCREIWHWSVLGKGVRLGDYNSNLPHPLSPLGRSMVATGKARVVNTRSGPRLRLTWKSRPTKRTLFFTNNNDKATWRWRCRCGATPACCEDKIRLAIDQRIRAETPIEPLTVTI